MGIFFLIIMVPHFFCTRLPCHNIVEGVSIIKKIIYISVLVLAIHLGNYFHLFSVEISTLWFDIKTAISIILNANIMAGAASILLGILGYLGKHWVAYYNRYKTSLLRCIWIIQQNNQVLTYIQSNTTTQSALTELELVPPFLENYAILIDDQTRKNLIAYNSEIIGLKHASESGLEDLLNKTIELSNIIISSLNGQILFTNSILKNPIRFYLFPTIFRWVYNKFIHPVQKNTQQKK
ncbi:MAG: hypothetical protein SOR58_01935 [Megasphaera massiliensis]|nr:hypothetical protein [Megasphaera massiliensis]